MSARILELNCLVDGYDESHIFTVNISENKTVSVLKEEIWNKTTPEFIHVPAFKLVIWRVSLPINDNLQQILKAFEPGEDIELRRPISTLSSLFSNPKVGHLHILIQRPGECHILISPLFHLL